VKHKASLGLNPIGRSRVAYGGKRGDRGVENYFRVIRVNQQRKVYLKFSGDFTSLESNSKLFCAIKIFTSLILCTA